MLMESPVIYFAGISTVLGAQYLIPTYQTRAYSMSLIWGAVASIVANILLIPVFHLYGAILSTLLAEMVVYAYQLYVIKKTNQLKIQVLYQGTGKYLLAGAIMFVVVFLLDKKLSSSILSLGIEVVIGMVIYVGLILIMRTRLIDVVRHGVKL